MVVMLCLVPGVRAQEDERLAGKISCHRDMVEDPQNRSHTKKLWDGYEISLGPARDGGVDGDGCTAAIYNSGGRVVFRTTGFSVVFDENYTGRDFDGDGKGDVVFITDTGGGMHCCWAYDVVSLSPKPHRLFDIAFGARFERDTLGKMLVWERIQGLTGLTTEASTPGGEKVFRVNQGKLVDATPEFCSHILSPNDADYVEHQRVLGRENISTLVTGSVPNDETASALLSLAYQYTFCRQFDKALHYLNLWPDDTGHARTTRKQVKVAFARSIKTDYPAFAARLLSLSRVPSTPTRTAARGIDWLTDLSAHETFEAAKLTRAEQEQIVDQVENTAFDVPDSFETELRVRRVSLGESDGLIVRGTHLLCGGTGNCQTWVFRRSSRKWLNMFERDAPVVSGFGFEQEASQGIENLLVSENSSAAAESRTLFRFDGKVYRESQCYEVSIDNGSEKIEKVSCKETLRPAR